MSKEKFFKACQQGDYSNVRKELYNGLNINMVDDDEYAHSKTGLHYAAKHGCHELVKKLLLNHPQLNVNAIDDYGETALHIAAQKGVTDIRPYHIWKEPNHYGVVKYLLEHKDIDPNCASYAGITPLYFAVYREYFDIAELLLSHPKITIDDKTYNAAKEINHELCTRVINMYNTQKCRPKRKAAIAAREKIQKMIGK